MFDIISFILGKKLSTGNIVVMDGESYTFTDDGEGNITITEGD